MLKYHIQLWPVYLIVGLIIGIVGYITNYGKPPH